ncbi:MAG: hypothetical protein LKG48_01930 [Lachnospiraceae bacterium]|nr:hypothetical protein [Lachnospiraceae bacterium]MCH4063244.1 hypothetical protein [Lachnospiraceae bacterium]MCH4105067.1 hypothetical protein [Lachnospiraceae bacterium]MCI1308525.1 hypothetical protein [Lachnospiraceae bacterium]MCI1333077.1 hypothetical protein [Lachnospiraceae bacterium]
MRKFLLRHIISLVMLIAFETTALVQKNRSLALFSLGYVVLIFVGEWYIYSLVMYIREKKKEER